MSHNILKKDTCVSSGAQKSWHGLDKLVSEITLENSGLNWTVEKQQIVLQDVFVGDGQEAKQKQIPSHFAVYCPEKDEIINVAKDSYTLIQNSQLFEIIEEALVGIPYKIATAVSLGNLKKVSLSVILEENQDYLINGEEFKNYLNFVSSHDGSMNLEAFDSNVRVCCANTLQWSRKDKGILNMRVRHTKNSAIRIENMKTEIEQLLQKREEFYNTYEGLMTRPMSSEKAEQIIAGFEATGELSTRTMNKVKVIHDLFLNGKGNKGETVADLLNGFTEYYSGHTATNAAKGWASSEFGQGRDKKLEVWDLVNNDAKMETLARRGEALLV